MANKVIEICVNGIVLKISTSEEESYVDTLVETIEADIDKLTEASPSISTINAVLLCTLDYLDRYEKARNSSSNMRSQIKEYLADAASSKLLLEEQKKRCDQLADEARELRAKMSGMVEPDNSGEAKRKADGIATALKEIEELRRVNDTAVEQCRALNDRITALNDFIANQDSELSRLRSDSEDKDRQLKAREDAVADAHSQIKLRQREIAQLRSELETLRGRKPEQGAGTKDYDNYDDMPNLTWADEI